MHKSGKYIFVCWGGLSDTPVFSRSPPQAPAFVAGSFGIQCLPIPGCPPRAEASTAPSFSEAASPSIRGEKLDQFSPFTTYFGFISLLPSLIF